MYSAGITPRLLEVIAAEPRILRYLDMPMQHASDAVLERMRRLDPDHPSLEHLLEQYQHTQRKYGISVTA